MDTTMAISGEKIKALREARAWSQAHLAEAAALSLRTVQRVEAEGTASAETRLAIAAALGTAVDAFNAPELPPAATPPVEHAVGVPIVFAASAAGLLFVLWIGSGLPPMVASHFGVAGDANSTLPRDQFVALMSVLLGALPSLLLWGATRAVRRGKVNIPNAGFWLAEPRRGATERWLHVYFTCLCVGVALLLAWVFWLVAEANRNPAHPVLDTRWTTGGVALLLAAATVWLVTLNRRFRRDFL
jgi:transcriptional regulator with XRE-family HTH domain